MGIGYGCGCAPSSCAPKCPPKCPTSPFGFLGNNWWILILVFFLFFKPGGCGGIGGLGGLGGLGGFGIDWIWIVAILIFILPNLGFGKC